MRQNRHLILGLIAGGLIPSFAQSQSHADSAACTPAAAGIVRAIKVQPDKAPDCSSLQSIAESVTRDCKNNDAKAIAIYNFMQLTHYHRQYPSEPGGIPALKVIVCYGWSLCGGLHSEESALWRALGWGWRFVGWSNPGHTTVEAQYDGRWHYLDVFLKFYAWMPDGKGGWTIAGEDDLKSDPQGLLIEAFHTDAARRCVYARGNEFVMIGDKVNWQAPSFLTCGDTLDGVVSGVKSRQGRGSPEGWGSIHHATGNYSTDVNLAPGFCLVNTWDPIPNAWHWPGQKEAPCHTCGGHKDTRNDPGIGFVLEPYINSRPSRSYANGVLTFAPDFSNRAFLKSFASLENIKYANNVLAPAEADKPAFVILPLASPYLMTKAGGEAVGAESVEVSVDGGKTYAPADLRDFTAAVKGKLAAHVRIRIKDVLKSLRIEVIVQNNPGALPYLSPGKNVVKVSVANPKALGDNRLVVTYGYRLGSRSKSFEQLCGEGKELAKQHNAKWSDTVVYAQKTFTARELPATFDVDCPTTKGQYPVYPRMMFLRREVVPPGSKPQPLPAGATEATRASPEELATLPNPFLVGAKGSPGT